MKEPSSEAMNVISYLHAKIQKEMNSVDSYIEVFFPSHSKQTLKEYLKTIDEREKRLIGVISLGSYANVTENLEWVNILGDDLKNCVIEKNIPFLGICFSHQLFAWMYGATVDFVEEREKLPERKYNEFRKIEVLDSKLKSIIGTNEFISKAKHEQEVKNIPNEHLELTSTSEHCKIEGLTHKIYPAFSVQTHPEEFHDSRQGWIFMKKFIGYFISNTFIEISSETLTNRK